MYLLSSDIYKYTWRKQGLGCVFWSLYSGQLLAEEFHKTYLAAGVGSLLVNFSRLFYAFTSFACVYLYFYLFSSFLLIFSSLIHLQFLCLLLLFLHIQLLSLSDFFYFIFQSSSIFPIFSYTITLRLWSSFFFTSFGAGWAHMDSWKRKNGGSEALHGKEGKQRKKGINESLLLTFW